MEKYQEIEGNLITLAIEGKFDVIAHGCNCFCTQGSGIAVPMKNTFGTDKFPLEHERFNGDINKLGQIDFETRMISAIDKKVMTQSEGGKRFSEGNGSMDDHVLHVVNIYSQYYYGQKFGVPIDYEALTLGFRKINKQFAGLKIGLPKIGAGLAKGDWNRIKNIIQTELKMMFVTIVIFPS